MRVIIDSLDFEFLQSGPAVIDYVEHPNPQIPIPNVIDVRFFFF